MSAMSSTTSTKMKKLVIIASMIVAILGAAALAFTPPESADGSDIVVLVTADHEFVSAEPLSLFPPIEFSPAEIVGNFYWIPRTQDQDPYRFRSQAWIKWNNISIAARRHRINEVSTVIKLC